MFGEPDYVDTQLVREPSFVQRLVDHNAVTRWVTTVRKQEIAEFHAGKPSWPLGITDLFADLCQATV
jgi:hypothetical protein